jgi:hypothetical protein
MFKNNVLIRKLRAPVYKSSLWIVICKDIVKAIDTVEDLVDHRIIAQEDKKTTDAYTYGYYGHDGIQRIIIFVNHKAKPGRIVHEVKHAVNVIFNWNGTKLSLTNDEHECYYLETIVDKVYDAIKLFSRKISLV